MPNNKLSKNVHLKKNTFGSSVDQDVANKTYRVNTHYGTTCNTSHAS